MYILYIDESGTPEIPGTTSHYVLAGLAMPIWQWKNCDTQINKIKENYALQEGTEIHTGWILRAYPEQNRIEQFESLSYPERKYKAEIIRKSKLIELSRIPGRQKTYRQLKKTYNHTLPYVHLSYAERKNFVKDIVETVSEWGECRLFAECVDKIHFDNSRSSKNPDEQAFEQIISRFEQFLRNINYGNTHQKNYGILIHDNNETVSRKHTALMHKFHKTGTLWTQIENIIETPLFVDSSLTSMVQIADVCAYIIRRYLEKGEAEFFEKIFRRADRKDGTVVGMRHFTKPDCQCLICKSHRQQSTLQNKLF